MSYQLQQAKEKGNLAYIPITTTSGVLSPPHIACDENIHSVTKISSRCHADLLLTKPGMKFGASHLSVWQVLTEPQYAIGNLKAKTAMACPNSDKE